MARTVAARPRTLSRAAIVEVAMRVLDAEGLDAVTMRRVATELDTGAASLYAHVVDKDDLYAALVDGVIGEVTLPERFDRRRWQGQLKDVLRATRAALAAHRDLAGALLGSVPVGPAGLVGADRLLALLLSVGLEPQVAAWSLDILMLYTAAATYEEAVERERGGPHLGAGRDVDHRTFFTGLDPATYPTLVAMAVPLTAGDDEQRFEFGLDLLVRGIAARAPRRAR